MLTFGSLFCGVGGFDLGFERAGMVCRWQVEIEPYQRAVLAEKWPNIPRWDDVRTFPPAGHDWHVDVICGGFPCQDISAAGKGAGINGARSGLWGEFFRIVCLLRPRYVVIENSPVLAVRGLRRILRDLASVGFDAEWQVVQASDFALPHSRKRMLIVAYPNGIAGAEGLGNQPDGPAEVFPACHQERDAVRVQAADCFVGVDDGVSGRAYLNRGRCVGNAIAVPVAEWVGKRLMDAN